MGIGKYSLSQIPDRSGNLIEANKQIELFRNLEFARIYNLSILITQLKDVNTAIKISEINRGLWCNVI